MNLHTKRLWNIHINRVKNGLDSFTLDSKDKRPITYNYASWDTLSL